MELLLYDTLSRGKKALRAPEPGKPITMYVCGPTVYGRAHIGNARPAVVFDVLYRLLRHLYGTENVRYARNITDIDDKIMAKAVAENRTPESVAREFEALYFADMAALGCLMPDFNPRATEHVAGGHGMIHMIEALIANGAAYESQGHVLFEVAKYPSYGRLSKRPMEEMLAGARVEVAPYKRAPGDFVLWKPSTAEQPGWESPWGRGRPGWHIECSAMIRSALGEDSIDIHGGGLDLQFPHHENERAQSACAHEGAELARIWMHNGFLTMGETKMSKSLGNILTPHELMEAGWDGEVLRLALLSAHYRQPLSWTDSLLEQSKKTLDVLYGKKRRMVRDEVQEGRREVLPEVTQSLADDLHVSNALKSIHDAARESDVQYNQKKWDGAAVHARSVVHSMKDLMGLMKRDSDEWFQAGIDEAAVTPRLERYRQARAAKDWAEADRLRDQLAADGVLLTVGKGGEVEWRRG